MRNKISILLIVLLTTFTLLCSCTPSKDATNNTADGYIFKPGSEIILVYSEYERDVSPVYDDGSGGDTNRYEELTKKIYDTLRKKSEGIHVKERNDAVAPAEHEIIVGMSSREISRLAYEELNSIKAEGDETRYLIYTDGSSVAIAYDMDDTYSTPEIAVDYFIENYLKGSSKLSASAGVLESEKINLVEYYQERDDALVSEQWETLLRSVRIEMTEALGEQEASDYANKLVYALRRFYSMYNDNLISWLANLLDQDICVCKGEVCENTKNCGGAAFYYSNSARNTKGFLPDAESTAQALGILKNTGMLRFVGDDCSAAFPEGLPEKFIRFAKALQDSETGYFYHPQWNKEELAVARLSRDMNYATSVLKSFGSLPTYTTPNGEGGDGIDYNGNKINTSSPVSLTSSLRISGASRVSKVIPTATASYPARMENETTWRNYLATLSLTTRSYEVGNELSSSAQQLVNRQAQLTAAGVSYNLIDITVKWFTDQQNKETGTWYFVDPNSEAYDPYYGNDGVLKISAWFNTVGRAFPRAKLAAQNAINAIMHEQDIKQVCNLYNTWFTVSNLKSNVRKHGSAEVANEFITELRRVAPEGIEKSLIKIADHQKRDGSFSYYQDHCSHTSQGMVVALEDTDEGDLNATSIATYGITGFIFSALDFYQRDESGDYIYNNAGERILCKVDIYTDSDRRVFLDKVSGLGGIVKDGEVDNSEPTTFDRYNVNAIAPEEVNRDLKTGDELYILPDTREGAEGNVLSFKSALNSGGYVNFYSKSGSGGSTYIFSSDICISDVSSVGKIININMGKGLPEGNVYMISLRARVVDGKMVIGIYDSSSTVDERSVINHLADVPYREWFTLKIEYYKLKTETTSDARIKIFLNGVCIAVSDNYYDNQGNKITGEGAPNETFNRTWISGDQSTEATVLFDNVAVYRERRAYSIEPLSVDKNVDGTDNSEILYDFESEASLPSGFVPSNPEKSRVSPVVENNRVNNKLVVGGGSILMPSNPLTKKHNRGTLSMDISLSAKSLGECGYISFIDTNVSNATVFQLDMKIVEVGGERYVQLYECPEGTKGDAIEGARFKAGEVTQIRIDFYHKEDMVLLYIGGQFINVSEAIFKNANRLSYGAAYVNVISGATAIIDNVVTSFDTFEFTEANGVKPVGDANKETFDTDTAVAVLGGGASLESGEGDKHALLATEGATVKLIASERSQISGAFIMEADVTVKDPDYLGNLLGAYVADSEGNPIFAIALIANEGYISIQEMYSGDKTYPLAISTIDSDTFNIRIEYYDKNQSATVYVNGSGVATTSVTYDERSGERTSAYAIFKSLGSCGVEIDNLLSDKMFKTQLILPDNSGANSEDSITGIMTLDSSANGNLPNAITGAFSTYGAGVSIQQMLKKIGDAEAYYSKVGKFTTNAGGNDSFFVKSNNTSQELKNAKKTVFEADLRLDAQTKGTVYQVIMGDSEKGLVGAYMFNIAVSGNNVVINDSSFTAGDKARTSSAVTAATLGEWFKLTVEYYVSGGTEGNEGIRIVVKINGDVLYVSDNYFKNYSTDAKPDTYINRIRFYSQSTSVAELYFDNIALYVDEGECKSDPTLDYVYGKNVPEENQR